MTLVKNYHEITQYKGVENLNSAKKSATHNTHWESES